MGSCLFVFSVFLLFVTASDGASRKGTRRNYVPLISVSLNVDTKNYLPRLLQSIDYPVEKVIIQVGNADPIVIADIQQKVATAALQLPNLHVNLSSIMYSNPGSANGFNFGLRHLATRIPVEGIHHDDWVLVVNSDIAFYPGVLGRLAKSVERQLSRDPLFGIGFTSLCCGSEWSAVVFTRRIVNTIGYLDENYYPAYYEDDDYAIRVYQSRMHAARFNNTPLLHGTIDGSKDYESGVAKAIYFVKNKKDPAIVTWRRLFEAGVKHSEAYLQRKWGMIKHKNHPPKIDCKSVLGMNGGCSVPYRHPFNDSSKALSWWILEQDGRKSILQSAGIKK